MKESLKTFCLTLLILVVLFAINMSVNVASVKASETVRKYLKDSYSARVIKPNSKGALKTEKIKKMAVKYNTRILFEDQRQLGKNRLDLDTIRQKTKQKLSKLKPADLTNMF